MKKKISIILILVVIVAIIITYLLSSSKGKILYTHKFYYELGSEQVQIYESGVVETDIEQEEPNHKVKFKKIKTLTKEELNDLIEKISEGIDDEEMKKYINKLIHGNSNYKL